jgi:stress-induced morphogen
MAIREVLGGSESKFEIDLKETIKSELTRKKSSRPRPNAPIVLRDKSGLPLHSRYYVVWDRFEGLSPLIRSSIVYHAIKEALGVEEALKTITASGLTVEEARDMGFSV